MAPNPMYQVPGGPQTGRQPAYTAFSTEKGKKKPAKAKPPKKKK